MKFCRVSWSIWRSIDVDNWLFAVVKPENLSRFFFRTCLCFLQDGKKSVLIRLANTKDREAINLSKIGSRVNFLNSFWKHVNSLKIVLFYRKLAQIHACLFGLWCFFSFRSWWRRFWCCFLSHLFTLELKF